MPAKRSAGISFQLNPNLRWFYIENHLEQKESIAKDLVLKLGKVKFDNIRVMKLPKVIETKADMNAFEWVHECSLG